MHRLNPEYDDATSLGDFVNLLLTQELLDFLVANSNIRAQKHQHDKENIPENSGTNACMVTCHTEQDEEIITTTFLPLALKRSPGSVVTGQLKNFNDFYTIFPFTELSISRSLSEFL